MKENLTLYFVNWPNLTNALESFSAMHAKINKPTKKKQTNTKRTRTYMMYAIPHITKARMLDTYFLGFRPRSSQLDHEISKVLANKLALSIYVTNC